MRKLKRLTAVKLKDARRQRSRGGGKCRLHVMPFGNSNAESQRDSGSKPRVARHELPWETGAEVNNPNGVAARLRKGDATPLGLNTDWAATQGSSFLATLGWRTQSLGIAEPPISQVFRSLAAWRGISEGIKAGRVPRFSLMLTQLLIGDIYAP